MYVATPIAIAGFIVLVTFVLGYIKPDDVQRIPPIGSMHLPFTAKRKFVLFPFFVYILTEIVFSII